MESGYREGSCWCGIRACLDFLQKTVAGLNNAFSVRKIHGFLSKIQAVILPKRKNNVIIFAIPLRDSIYCPEKMTSKHLISICFIATVFFHANAQPAIFNMDIQDVDCEHPKGYIDVTIKGGLAPYRYQWSTGATTEDIADLSAGTYFLTVSDAKIPPDAIGVSFSIHTDTIRPIANAGPDLLLTCAHPQVILSGAASSPSARGYDWSTPDGYTRPDIKFTDAVAYAPGTYILEVEEYNGCKDYDTVLVSQSPEMPISNAGDTVVQFCKNPLTTLDGSASSTGPNYVYEWFAFGASIFSGKYTLKPRVESVGRYYLKVKDTLSGCFSISSMNVVAHPDNPQLVFDYNAPAQLTCGTDTVKIDAIATPANLLYEWSLATPTGHIVAGQGTPSIWVDEPGIYAIKVTNPQNGCKLTNYRKVDTLWLQPTADAGKDAVIGCGGSASIRLTAGGKVTDHVQYYWYDGRGDHLNPFLTPTVTVNKIGIYVLKAIDYYSQCFDLDTVVVLGKDFLSDIGVSDDTLNCKIKTIRLLGNAPNLGTAADYQWFTDKGHFVNAPNGTSALVDSAGVYYLFAQLNACKDTAQVNIVADHTKPFAILPPKEVLPCEPPKLALSVETPTGSIYAYRWDTSNGHILSGQDQRTLLVDKDGAYTLTVQDQRNGCTAMFNTAVHLSIPPEIEANAIDASCYDKADGILEALGSSSLLWSLEGAPPVTKPYFDGLKAGEYQVKGIDTLGCSSTKIVRVGEPPSIMASLGPDFSILQGKDTVLQLEHSLPDHLFRSVSWTIGDQKPLPCREKCLRLPIKPLKSTLYMATLTDNNGCQVTDTLVVHTEKARFYAPNIFDPDAGNENNRFYVLSNDPSRQLLALRVYDRWGTLVFEKKEPVLNNPADGWDGTTGEKPAPEGVYIWLLEWRQAPLGEPTRLSGDVSLIRSH